MLKVSNRSTRFPCCIIYIYKFNSNIDRLPYSGDGDGVLLTRIECLNAFY